MSKNRDQKNKGKTKTKNSHFGKGKNDLKDNSFKKGKSAKNLNIKKEPNLSIIRLNKYIANSGICSRREADMHISIGSITVNGKVITEMGFKVKLIDDIRFDGARIYPENKAYVLLNKPKGFATTTSEGKGRTVMDLVANATNSRIRPIGRLGRNSTGLLLFTNDDIIHAKFTNSKHGVTRLFQVELDKNLKYEDLIQIREGFKIAGKSITVEDISYIDGLPKKEIGLKIKNTGNTIVRTIFEHFNYDIIKIDCVMIAELTKKDIPRGHWKHLTQLEVNTLKML